MSQIIEKPKHEQILIEISSYDRDKALDEVIDTLWEIKPKLALWMAIEFQRPY